MGDATPEDGGRGPSRVTVVTVVHGRHDHLREQRRVLRAFAPGTPHVVVATDDADIDGVLGHSDSDAGPVAEPDAGPAAVPARDDDADDVGPVTVRHVGTDPRGLPLALARNLGVETALAGGAEVVILLDVDCVPGPQLVSGYERAAGWAPGALLAGPVTYLEEHVPVPADPWALRQLTDPHPARPAPPGGELRRDGDHDLFWTLSCAMTATTWRAIGGFDEDYVGYGGEDTDFGRSARELDVDLVWVGGAHAYHQFHPVSRPPVEHLADIARNAMVFRAKWHEWPMSGWLEEFERRGLMVRRGDEIVLLHRVERGVPSPPQSRSGPNV